MTTTISSSETINPLLLTVGESIVITGGSGVTVSTADGLGLVSLGDSFTVEDQATFVLTSAIGINVGDSFMIGNEGTLEIGAGVNANVLSDTSFTAGTGEDLIVEQGVSLSLLGGISGFGFGDTIDVAGGGAPVNGTVSTSYNGLTNMTMFTIDTSAGAQTLNLAGNYTGDQFSATADGSGGFNLMEETPCFVRGTRILTVRGEVPVEEIEIGDLVLQLDGMPAPVIFVGRRTVDCARKQTGESAWPVRIPAGALSDGVPSRDLLVSPDHALFLDGVLVPAKDLIDGLMIRLDTTMPRVSYYHIELPQHAVLLAEGAAAESFLNLGHRGRFDNVKEKVVLHPEALHQARIAQSVAPLVTDGPVLKAIRAALHTRALRHGYRVVEALNLTLRMDGKNLTPIACSHDEVTFALPPGGTQAVLVSDVFIPAEIDPSSSDRRVLGVAVTGLLVNGERMIPETMIDAADLHPRMEDERASWTRGMARLKLPKGAQTITVRVAGWPKHWREGEQEAA